ncbi:MAG: hypothetical protein AAF959_16115 [Cyanobacteria bacterium P01_D01_bin.56]
MPFLPLFIVIGIFLATSKILQPNQQKLQSVSEDYDDRMLSQALIDYIAREARTQSDSENSRKSNVKTARHSHRGQER